MGKAAQQALAPDAAALRFAAQVKRRPLAGIPKNSVSGNVQFCMFTTQALKIL